MGTTLSALVCTEDTATIGNIGDSRVYVFRDSRLSLLTHDDALVAHLVESGKITSEEAKVHPMRHVLTQALGLAEDIAVQLIEFPLKARDRLLLSSDGLHGVLDDVALRRIIEQDEEPGVVADRFVVAAKEQGGPDNISCIVIVYG
jgi:protein phosphatase